MPLSKLNKEQLAAATAPKGKNLVIASAGTGKTSTIVARIAHLIQRGTPPERILLLTFTNKAAQEMVLRLGKFFPPQVTRKICAGTFHSVSNLLLKRLGRTLILKQPSELKTLLKSVLERRSFSRISDLKPYSGAYLYDIYSLFCNACEKDFAAWFSRNYEEQAEFAEIYADVLGEFEEQKAAFGYADFNDLLLKMREALATHKFDFAEVLVDEYQDTNSLQGSLIDAFDAESLFCVGDFDQSIYAFNGANIGIIGSFSLRYKDAKIFALNTNYRSTAKILELANRVIENNERLYPKRLEVGRAGECKPPRLLVFDELFAQYDNIAQTIAQSPLPKEEVAIIFRNNSSADGIEMALRERGIGCKRRGGVEFLESREIKALVDLVGILVNPKDIFGMLHTLEYARGVGAAAAREIYEILSAVGHKSVVCGLLEPDLTANYKQKERVNSQMGLFSDFSEFLPSSRFGALGLDAEFMKNPVLNYSNLNANGALFVSQIRDFLLQVRGQVVSEFVIKSAINSKLYANIVDVLATKRATLKNGNVDLARADEAKKKIYAKAEVLAQMTKRHPNIYNFYNFLTLGVGELEGGNGVNLLTVHASKGLEFGLVFVVDLAQGRFPNLKMMSSVEEERRLFYVAVTRAKDELVLSYAKYDKIRKVEYMPSCFLVEAGMAEGGGGSVAGSSGGSGSSGSGVEN